MLWKILFVKFYYFVVLFVSHKIIITILDDGAVKIWKNYINEYDLKLITAFQVIQDLLPTTRGKNIFFFLKILLKDINFLNIFFSHPGAGLVLHWEQHSCQLLASGDIRHIRIWDAERESKIQVLIRLGS